MFYVSENEFLIVEISFLKLTFGTNNLTGYKSDSLVIILE